MNRNTLVALITVQVIFGLWPVAAKLLFQHFDPLSIAGIRTLGGALLLYPLASMLAKRKLDVRKDGWQMAGLALLGVIINQLLFITGLEKTTAINATLIISTIPVFTYLMAVLAKREVLGPKRLLGIFLAMAGVAVVIGVGGAQFGLEHLVGDIMVLANCISFSAYLVLSKPLAEKVHPLSLIAWQFIVASLVLVPLAIWVGAPEQLQAATPQAWGLVAFAVLGPSVLTYLLNATALRHVPSSTVAVFIFIQPVLTTILAAWILGETLVWTLIPGAALVFAGVSVVAWRSRVAHAADAADVLA